MELTTIKNKYRLKELELNALLEITQSINNNLPEASLYKIYEFTLRGNLNVKKVALFVFDNTWECKVNFGTSTNCFERGLDESFLTQTKLTDIEGRDDVFGEFDFMIPIYHKGDLLAVVFIGEIYKGKEADVKESSVRFIQALTNIIIVAIENKKLARQQLEQEALRKELEIASDVQQFLFPDKLPHEGGLRIEASYLPHDRVGGDYYDYIPISETKFLICIADVSGKGIPAALMMSNFQASLRTLIRQTQDLKEIVNELNYQVLENAKGEKFITFFAGLYDYQTKTLQYINCGHNPPLLITESGLEKLDEGSTVLGAINPLPFLKKGLVRDLKEFLLFCYTDGLTETCNEANEEFGPERLEAYFLNNDISDIRRVHQDLIISLDGFKGNNGYHDDITMLTTKFGQ